MGSSIEPQLRDGGGSRGRLPGLLAGLACTCTVGVPATLLSLVHPRPPVSNLVGKDLFLGPCNLAMGSHDQWQLQAEYTVGSISTLAAGREEESPFGIWHHMSLCLSLNNVYRHHTMNLATHCSSVV